MHIPVLLQESVDSLAVKQSGIYVDATVGLGGHAGKILEQLGAEGALIGIDLDKDAVVAAGSTLKCSGKNVKVVCGNYTDLKSILNNLKISAVDGVLFDLGVSSLQIDTPGRGFSFRYNGALDMRMNHDEDVTAGDVVNSYPQAELEQIFRELGEERYSRIIAKRIVSQRARKPFKSTQELADTVRWAIPSRHKSKIHPATRVFQALRIHINNELANLQKVLNDIPSLLNPFGRIAIISFHSLEDRIVKRAFIRMKQENIARLVTSKPVTPSPDEVMHNPRAHSAKLRVAEKL